VLSHAHHFGESDECTYVMNRTFHDGMKYLERCVRLLSMIELY